MKQSEYLEHYGILGMKWGVRRSRGPDGTVGGKQKKVRVKDMSDEELKKRVSRLSLEKQYKDLTKADVSSGQKFVQDVLLGSAKQTAITYTSKYMNKAVEELLKSKK